MKKFIALFLSIFSVSSLMAQSVTIPEDVVYETEDDFRKYEKDVVAVAKWLVEAPLDKAAIDHLHAFKFISNWALNSPYIDASMTEGVSELFQKNNSLMYIYLACSVQYQIENKTTDRRASTKFGLEKIIEVYQKGNGIKNDRFFDSLVKANEKGEMDKWMNQNLKF